MAKNPNIIAFLNIKTSKAGLEYLSGKLQLPDMAEPIRVVAFKSENENGEYYTLRISEDRPAA